MSIRILKHDLSLSSLVLMAMEACIAVLALFLVASLWGAALPGWRTSVLFAGIVVLSSAAMGLYNMRLRTHVFGLALRILLTAAFALLLTMAGLAAFPANRVTVREFAYALCIFVLLDLLARVLLAHFFCEGFLRRRVLVYGAGTRAQTITNLRRRTDRFGFTVVGYLPVDGEIRIVPGDRIIEPNGNLREQCERLKVDEIIVAMDDRRRSFPSSELLDCRVHGIEVLDVVAFLERETGSLRLDLLMPGWMIFSPGFHHSWASEVVARLLDMTASLALLALSWPFMLVAALAIKIEDGIRAPVLYRQLRVGKEGSTFTVLKFRSMQLDAEADGIARWASPEDARVTRVGRWIRPTRIDELPQLLNILRGDMRFVGPRPERPEFVCEFDRKLPYYRQRHSVRPGLTGWAQLRCNYGASEKDALEKLKYDLYYVKNHNFVFDLVILIQTVEVILFGKGAR
jgi:sugar transferase (PEP-CTERM system associated)